MDDEAASLRAPRRPAGTSASSLPPCSLPLLGPRCHFDPPRLPSSTGTRAPLHSLDSTASLPLSLNSAGSLCFRLPLHARPIDSVGSLSPFVYQTTLCSLPWMKKPPASTLLVDPIGTPASSPPPSAPSPLPGPRCHLDPPRSPSTLSALRLPSPTPTASSRSLDFAASLPLSPSPSLPQLHQLTPLPTASPCSLDRLHWLPLSLRLPSSLLRVLTPPTSSALALNPPGSLSPFRLTPSHHITTVTLARSLSIFAFFPLLPLPIRRPPL